MVPKNIKSMKIRNLKMKMKMIKTIIFKAFKKLLTKIQTQ